MKVIALNEDDLKKKEDPMEEVFYEQGIEDMIISICEGLASIHSKGNKQRNIRKLVHQWLDFHIKKKDPDLYKII